MKDASRAWTFKHLGQRGEHKLLWCRREEAARRQIAPEPSIAQTSPHETGLIKVPRSFSQAAEGHREQLSHLPVSGHSARRAGTGGVVPAKPSVFNEKLHHSNSVGLIQFCWKRVEIWQDPSCMEVGMGLKLAYLASPEHSHQYFLPFPF